MPKIRIDKNKCKGCMLCAEVCPNKLIERSKKLNKRGIHYVEIKNAERCTRCRMCALICPDVCIEIYR